MSRYLMKQKNRRYRHIKLYNTNSHGLGKGYKMKNKNYMKLRERITEVFGSGRNFAKALGKSATTVSKKLCGESEFSQADIMEWCKLLKLEPFELAFFYEVAI